MTEHQTQPDPRDSAPCKDCGQCCDRLPGSAFPEDFTEPPSIDLFRRLAASGKWAVDWWEGDVVKDGDFHECHYWRPSIVGKKALFHASWGGQCSWLTPDGCEAQWEDRPSGCKYLCPSKDHNCQYVHPVDTGKGCKEHAALKWRPWHRLFEQLREELQV